MSEFQSDPRRDATHAIRGYLYQAERTIECWLRIGAETELHLECGEDIDHVSNVLGNARKTEQVAYSSENTNLRRPKALTAVANFLTHRHKNPDADLTFRYVTNARVGKEQVGSVKTAGITLWRLVRESALARESAPATDDGVVPLDAIQPLLDIHKLMSGASRPPRYNKEGWNRFRDFWKRPVTDATAQRQMVDVIKRFEWSTDAPLAASMQQHLGDLLIEQGHASDPTSGDDLYFRLLGFVFKLLATDGPKILTRRRLHDTLSRLPGRGEQALVNSVFFRLAELEADVSSLKEFREEQTQWRTRQEGLNQSVDSALSFITGLVEDSGRWITSTPAPSLDVPQPTARLAQREGSVRAILEAFDQCTWVAMNGAASCGKTHLAILTTRHRRFAALVTDPGDPARRGAGPLWLSMRDLTTVGAVDAIKAMCAAFAGPAPLRDRSGWFERFCTHCGDSALLVLDDLPRMRGFDTLAACLTDLSHAAARSGLKLLSTSHYPPPPEVEERLGTRLVKLQCPSLRHGEAREVLLAHGAPPERFTAQRAQAINLLLKGHPLLLSAAAGYFSERNWRPDDREIDSLLSSRFAAELNEVTLRRLLDSAESDERQLLYRLNTSGGLFSPDEARLLAGVPPSLSHPGEKLSVLTGLWVQHESAGRLSVSPLVQALGETELAPETRQGCHRVLARQVLKRGKLDQHDLSGAIQHFRAAEDWEEAGSFLAHALGLLWERNPTTRPVNDAGLIGFWAAEPLPRRMSLALRVLIRAYHVGFSVLWGEEREFVTGDLVGLLEKTMPAEGWAMPGLLHVAYEVLAEKDFVLYCQVLRSLTRVPSGPLTLPNGKDVLLPDDFTWAGLVWVKADRIRDAATLGAWLEVIESLSPEGIANAMDDELAPTACLEVGGLLWREELNKPEAERDWTSCGALLTEAANRAFSAGLPLLGAAFLRSVLTIQGEYQRDFETARATATGGLENYGDNEDAAFLVEDSLGRAFGTAKRYEEARFWLDRARRRGGTFYALQRVQSLVCLSKNVADSADTGPVAAIDYVQSAVELAQRSALPVHEQVRTLAEMGIACWLANDLKSAFDAFEQAVQGLLDGREISDYWKDAFVVVGHALGYIASEAISGTGPQSIGAGDAYIAPYRTMFISFHPTRARLYNPTRDVFLRLHLANLAQGVGRDDRALAWALPGLEMARRDGQSLAILGMATRVVVHYVESGDLDAAAGLAREQVLLMTQMYRPETDDGDLDLEDLDAVEPADVASLDEGQRTQVEGWVALRVLLPAAFQVAKTAVTGEGDSKAAAGRLVNLCLAQFDLTQHPFWRDAADILRQTYEEHSGYRALAERPLQSVHAEFAMSLRTLAYLGATLQSDIDLGTALQLHLMVLPTLDELLTVANRSAYRCLVVPFFFTYWQSELIRHRDRFRDPSLPSHLTFSSDWTVDGGVAQARSMPPESGVKQLMIVCSLGLSVPGPSEARKWLTSDAGGSGP